MKTTTLEDIVKTENIGKQEIIEMQEKEDFGYFQDKIEIWLDLELITEDNYNDLIDNLEFYANEL